MSQIRLRRTKKQFNEESIINNSQIGDVVVDAAEPVILDYNGVITDTETPYYMAAGLIGGGTALKNAPVFKAFKSIDKANHLVFWDGDKIVNENGVELGTSKINVKEITDLADLPEDKSFYIVLVDEDGHMYRINIADMLKFNRTTANVDHIGW